MRAEAGGARRSSPSLPGTLGWWITPRTLEVSLWEHLACQRGAGRCFLLIAVGNMSSPFLCHMVPCPTSLLLGSTWVWVSAMVLPSVYMGHSSSTRSRCKDWTFSTALDIELAGQWPAYVLSLRN